MRLKTIFGTIVPIVIGAVMGTGAMGLEALLGGGGEDPEVSISAILTTEKPKDKKKLVMDGHTDEKQFLRIDGDDKSIVSFSVHTHVHKTAKSHPSLPALENYDSPENIIYYIRKSFEEKFLPKDLIKYQPTRIGYHAFELGEEKVNKFGKRKRGVSCAYTDLELNEMSADKKKRLDFDYNYAFAIDEALRTKDFDIKAIFSYYDRRREFIVEFKTVRTQEKIEALPEQAEKLHENAKDLFNDLGDWLELTLDMKKELIVKERIPENMMYG